MRFKYSFTLLLILVSYPSIAQVTQAPFQHGINLSGWFQYLSHASEIQIKQYTKQDFENLKSLGCDHVRLPIQFFSMTGPAPVYTIDPLFFTFMDQVINWVDELNMHLILDNHSYDPAIAYSPDIQHRMLSIWAQMAEHYKNHHNRIYYEICNEPYDIDDATWNNIQQQVIDTIRTHDTIHSIIVGPANFYHLTNLELMPEYEDTNLIYTFHFYEPMIFTHQGSSWIEPSLENLAGIPYPCDGDRMPELPGELEGTWIEYAYDHYYIDGTDTWVHARLDTAVQFMNDREVPLWCGEFGVFIPNSYTEDRARWIESVRTFLESNGIAWAMWEFGDGCGIFEPDLPELFDFNLNIPIIEALGFTAPAQGEYTFLSDSIRFTIYDDYIADSVFRQNSLANGYVTYYSENNPAEGDLCISWSGSDQYGDLGFRFSPVRDLSRLRNEGYMLDFWARCSATDAQIDVRFADTDNDIPDDRPWRSRFTVDNTMTTWNGTWQHIQIPLTDFAEYGTWDDGDWHPPQGDFDWSKIEYFNIAAEHHSLSSITIDFDCIRINGPYGPTSVDPSLVIHDNAENLTIRPNPLTNQAKITFTIHDNNQVKLTLYNTLGQKIKVLAEGIFQAGQQQIIWDGADSKPGVYYVRLQSGYTSDVCKVLLLK